jgi:hypothetical protein
MALDIVRIFEQYANDKSFIFHYGRKNVLNLIDTGSFWTGQLTDIYFLFEYRKILNVKNQTQTGVKGTKFNGTFYLLKHSNLDQNFFQEVGMQGQSKYVNNIEPLLAIVQDMENYFACTDIVIERMEADDVTDILDLNGDGLMINFTAYVPKEYNLPSNGASS